MYKPAQLLIVAIIPALLTGCAEPIKPLTPRQLAARNPIYIKEGKLIQADPVGYLKRLHQRCAALEQYQLVFYRQERLGRLRPLEKIIARFRREPFSVKFEWDDPRADYYESLYVEGQNDNKLIVRERKGLLLLPPTVRAVDPQLSSKIGKSKNPITDFGLAHMVRRTLGPITDPQIADQIRFSYGGVVLLDPTDRPAHHLQILRPVTTQWLHAKQDFYIDAETLLPAGVDLWNKDGTLDARYRYADVRTDVSLTDQDFRLIKNHPPAKGKK